MSLFLNCNKIKKMKITEEQIAESCTDSELVELSEDKKMIRRKENKTKWTRLLFLVMMLT